MTFQYLLYIILVGDFIARLKAIVDIQVYIHFEMGYRGGIIHGVNVVYGNSWMLVL